MADITNVDSSQRARFNYSPNDDKRSKNGRRKYNKKQRQLMKENPETVIYDYKYDCHDDSEVYTLDDNPCNAKFFTDRPADWLRGSITYYSGLYDKDQLKHKPQVKTTRRGQQVRICGENEQECQISMFLYNTGIVMIQGCDCDEWEHRDMPQIKTLLSDSNNASINIQNCTRDTSYIESSSVADISTDSLSKSSFSARKLLLAASLKISSFINKTPLNKKSSDISTNVSPSNSMSDTQSVSNLEDNCTNDLISISLGRKLPVSSTPINDQIRDKPIQTSNNYIHLNTEEKQIQELLDYDENSSDNDVPEYNPDSSSIKEHPECQNCEFLRTYINHCEEAMNSLQEELYQLKSKDKNNSPSSRLKGVDADKSESASTIKDKSTDHGKKKKKQRPTKDRNHNVSHMSKEKETPHESTVFKKRHPTLKSNDSRNKVTNLNISVVGDSNVRRLGQYLRPKMNEKYTVWTNPGSRLQDVENRAQDMISDSDIAVVHLGTNDALGKSSDNDCLAQCSDSIDKIHQSTSVPMLVCSVPPTRSMHGQRRVNMINSLLKYKCSMDNKLCFVNTKLTASDIGGDGVHLTDTGKDKLASSIHNATKDFYVSLTNGDI